MSPEFQHVVVVDWVPVICPFVHLDHAPIRASALTGAALGAVQSQPQPPNARIGAADDYDVTGELIIARWVPVNSSVCVDHGKLLSAHQDLVRWGGDSILLFLCSACTLEQGRVTVQATLSLHTISTETRR